MKSNLVYHRYKTREEWLSIRANFIGGSDVGTILGLNPYFSNVELFYKKLGFVPEQDTNEAMFWGSTLEEVIAKQWQFWENDFNGMLKNSVAGRPVAKAQRVQAVVSNVKWPWLGASVDRLVTHRMVDGRLQSLGKNREVLEIKTLSGWAEKMWENGIPPQYVVQLQTYLLVLEMQHGEMALLKDGRRLEVLPFDRQDDIVDHIIERTGEFEKRLFMARAKLYDAVVKEPKPMFEGVPWAGTTVEEASSIVQDCEPDPDASPAYERFINARYKAGKALFTVPANDEIVQLARDYHRASTEIGAWDERKTEASNRIKAWMKDAEKIDMGAAGFITWRADAKGTRRFVVNYKPEGV